MLTQSLLYWPSESRIRSWWGLLRKYILGVRYVCILTLVVFSSSTSWHCMYSRRDFTLNWKSTLTHRQFLRLLKSTVTSLLLLWNSELSNSILLFIVLKWDFDFSTSPAACRRSFLIVRIHFDVIIISNKFPVVWSFYISKKEISSARVWFQCYHQMLADCGILFWNVCVFILAHLYRGFGFANASPVLKTVDPTKLKAALLLTSDRNLIYV